jgi:endonuclease YncB( thermonuclease family)
MPGMTAIAIAAFLVDSQAAAAEPYGPYQATVTRVIDGDTLEGRAGLTQRTSLRVEGIDTPERNGCAMGGGIEASVKAARARFREA